MTEWQVFALCVAQLAIGFLLGCAYKDLWRGRP